MFYKRSWFLKISALLFLIISLISFSTYLLFFRADIEALYTRYPVWNGKAFELVESKPKHWISVDEVSEYAKWAIIVSEDWAFYEHHGIDLKQLRIALADSIREGYFVRGASTITQQVIKNSFLSLEKTLTRKFVEAVMALKLDYYFSKDQILEYYLNIIHLGKDLYGIGPAAKYYFNKKPIELSAREGAFLAMLLPSPERYSVSFEKKELTDFARSQIDEILIKLRQAKVYDEETRQEEADKKFYWERTEVEQNVLDDFYLLAD